VEYRLTKTGHQKCQNYISELKAKQKEILDAGLDNGMWHYVFEIWFENDDTCSIYDISESNRSEYLSETENEELQGIIYNLCKDKINL